MLKTEAVAALGHAGPLAPARMAAALAANDRLKFVLTVVQAAAAHAADPTGVPMDLRRDYANARMDAPFLLELPAEAWTRDGVLHCAGLGRVHALLQHDLRQMARPLEGSGDAAHDALMARVTWWCDWLGGRDGDQMSDDELRQLTSGKRGAEDSLHILVMDLHKALNRLAAELSDETIEGAHVWHLAPDDGPRVAAFMRGLNRTRALKFTHPGLDTAATREGDRLLIQNDIGTNDAHVLVIQVLGQSVSLTYSDLHERRFAFFQGLLAEVGAVWKDVHRRQSAGLNAGEEYILGTARFDCDDEAGLHRVLEALGARIVFLIDWNRARKRLRRLVGNRIAVAVLTEAVRREVGHMGWLLAGGDRVVFAAMEALGPDHFRIGDRLDATLGRVEAEAFLVESLALATAGQQAGLGQAQIEDRTRLLLARALARHQDEFAALQDHAAFCQTLAENLRDALAHGAECDPAAAQKLSERAIGWERKADQLVIRLRSEAARNPHRADFQQVIERADDVADALEEAAFVLSLIAEGRYKGWNSAIREGLQRLVGQVLEATQDHVRVLAIAQTLTGDSSAEDGAEFLSACWRVVNAERTCDRLTRELRRLFVAEIDDAASLQLATDFACALEESTDALLRTEHALRSLMLARIGMPRRGATA